jgi:hypothetical protein
MDEKKNPQRHSREERPGLGFTAPEPGTEKRSPGQMENEGEGNKTADRQYREHVREFEEQHDVESLGRAARRDVERDPDTYRAAEKEGKKHLAEEDRELHKKE